LADHLAGTACLAEQFAAGFGAGDLAALTGWWHDLGKYGCAWQEYLRAREEGRTVARTGHKLAGAAWAARRGAVPAAFAIAGHHGGLPADGPLRVDVAGVAEEHLDTLVAAARTDGIPMDLDGRATAGHLLTDGDDGPLTLEFLTRLVFSALVDADFLDTAAHFADLPAPKVAAQTDWDELADRFDRRRAELLRGRADDPLRRLRETIAAACVGQADTPPGFFRLAVPTGTGKTLTALQFALTHARHHRLDRVIVAVPFTSITEQTASVYRQLLDSDDQRVVLEHHSARARDLDWWARLGAENWDVPVVVTTTVQLFESLFAHTPAAMRKVHRLARAVVVLDEVQALPMRLLVPILDGLKRITAVAGSTVVLASATQPRFWSLPPLRDVTVTDLAEGDWWRNPLLQRATIRWEPSPMSVETLADTVAARDQAMVIVNSRRDAARLARALADRADAVWHLSTRMCPAHRRHVLATVRDDLTAGRPCRLVATQVVEAGVDLDFPAVWRATAPADSLQQAAGRCNREGRQPAPGIVTVFDLVDGAAPGGWYRTATERTLTRFGGGADLADPDALADYYDDLYGLLGVGDDLAGIQERRAACDFPAVAERFQMIDQDDVDVVVVDALDGDEPWIEPDAWTAAATAIDRLRAGHPLTDTAVLRALQPFTVAVRRWELTRQPGTITALGDGTVQVWNGGYHPLLGIEPLLEQEDLVL
jgi:CRISPR-associated endonuclease/helicase Cas3